MKLGINLRLEYIDDVLAQKPDVQFFEIILENWFSPGPHHEKLIEIRKNYDVSFHCVGMNLAGLGELDQNYVNKVKQLIGKFEPFQLSDHLCFQSFDGHYHHDLLPFAYNDESFERVRQRVDQIQSQLGQKLLIENLSSYIEFSNSNISEVSFLNKLVDKVGCGLLLDLNNILVNEKNLKISAHSFLKEIVWEAVEEVHVAGPEKQGDLYVDTHGSDISAELLDLVSEFKSNILDLPIVYERDNNIEELARHIQQIAKVGQVLDGI